MPGKKLLSIFVLFLFSIFAYAQDNNFSAKLGKKENPILSPDALKNIPYVRLFLEMEVVPMIVWDKAGGLIAANDAYLSLIGYTRQEMQSGQIDWVTITPEEYRSLDKHCIEQLETKETCLPYVKEYVRKDGKHIPIKLWNARNMAKDGTNVAIILPLKLTLSKLNKQKMNTSEEI